jgi:type II secretory pathway component GspD/PulD (secretin)
MAMPRTLILQACVTAVAAYVGLCGVCGAAFAEDDRPAVGGLQRVTIDFEDAAVPDVARFYAELLDRNFVLGPDLADVRITILAPRPVSPEEAWRAFVTALGQRGLTVRREGKFWRIAKIHGAAPLPPGMRRYALSYANSDHVARALQQLAGERTKVVSWPETNSIIVVGPAPVARRIFEVARALDQPGARREIHVVELQHADAVQMAETLRGLLTD